MRLIDADTLMDFYLRRPTEEFVYERRFTAEDVALRIQGEPTIDPVKHGHWVENPIGCSCSVCGEVHRYDVLTANMTHLYCNHCEAKMDEEV